MGGHPSSLRQRSNLLLRRVALALIAGGFCALLLLCGAGALLARSTDGDELVLPGAGDTQIDGRGTGHLRITYSLPRRQSLQDLNYYFRQRGWRRVTVQNYDRPGPVFARAAWFGVLREVMVINPRPAKPHTAEISLARCFHIADLLTCP